MEVIGLITGIVTLLSAIKNLIAGGQEGLNKEVAKNLKEQLIELEEKIISLGDFAKTIQSYRRLYEDSLPLAEGANSAIKTMLMVSEINEKILDTLTSSTLSNVQGIFNKLQMSFKVIRSDICDDDQREIEVYINRISTNLGKAEVYVESSNYKEYRKQLLKIGEEAGKISCLTGAIIESSLRDLEGFSSRR